MNKKARTRARKEKMHNLAAVLRSELVDAKFESFVSTLITALNRLEGIKK